MREELISNLKAIAGFKLKEKTMKKRIILTIIFVLVAFTATSGPQVGLEYSLSGGIILNPDFTLYQDNQTLLEATLGNSTYTSAMLRLYVSTFFVQTKAECIWYLIHTNMQKAMFEVSIGQAPYDFLEFELGWKYRDSYTLSAPSEFHLAEHSIYFCLSGNIGNTP